MNNETNQSTSFWHRLGLAFRKILGLVVILAIIGLIGGALYFTVPYLYQKFIIPIETNTARLTEIENSQAAGLNLLGEKISGFQVRQIDQENRLTEIGLQIVELQGQVQVLTVEIQAHSQALTQLEAIQTTLDELAATSSEHEALLKSKDSLLADLQDQVLVSRAVELLSRSRLYLSQSNFGLAEQDVQAARDLLSDLAAGIPGDQSSALQDIIVRLDLALSNLPTFPVIAADDMEIAWQSLINYLPDHLGDEPSTATASPSATQAPTLNADPTETP